VFSDLITPLALLSPTLVALLELIPLTLAVILYWNRAMKLSWAGRPVPAWRQVSFGFGLFLASFVLFNPLGYLADELVIAHMIEHLIIGDIASLFLVLGLTRSIIQPVLAIPLFTKLQFLANPLVAMPLWALNLYVWHIPVLYDSAYGGALVHGLEHAMFLAFGMLVWMPVFGPLPVPSWFGPGSKIIYTAVVRFGAAVLGNVLMWSQVTIYQNYAEGQAKWGLTAIADQSIAGVIMMVEGTFLLLGVLAYTYFQQAQQSIRKQELLDLAYLEGYELDDERAERAVRAGHGDLLEKRIRSGGKPEPVVPVKSEAASRSTPVVADAGAGAPPA
jgi:cytochrome c oxidase assembly factor CtaG